MLISYACIFVSSACVACEVCASKSKDRTTKKSAMARIMAFAGIPLTYIAAGAVDFGFYGSSALGAQYLLFSGVSVLYELIRTLAVLLVVLLVVRKAVKKGREETLAVFSLKGTYSRAVAASTFVVFLSFILLERHGDGIPALGIRRASEHERDRDADPAVPEQYRIQPTRISARLPHGWIRHEKHDQKGKESRLNWER